MTNKPANPDEEKEEFFKKLDDLKPASYGQTSEMQQAYEGMFAPNEVKTGMLGTIPSKCGKNCFYSTACPKHQNPDQFDPEANCPVEAALVHQLFQGYVNDLDVDTTRFSEVALVRDLVNQDVQQMRASAILSKEHFIQEVVAGISENGEVMTQPDLHKAVDYEDRVLKRKEKLRNALLATREARVKAGGGKMDDAQSVASMLHEVREYQNEIRKQTLEDAGYAHYDPYIEDQVEDAEVVESNTDDQDGS